MWEQAIARTILTLRLALLAIAGGIIVFGIVAGVLVSAEVVPAQPRLGSSLLPALLIVAVLMIVAFLLVRQGIRTALTRTQPGGRTPELLLARFRTLNIVGSALAEVPAMFGIVVFLLTRQWVALLAPALSLGALALLFPSPDKYARFAEDVAGSRDI